MFCPRCGQEQISDETRFCSRCGFLLTGVPALLAGGGELATPSSDSQAVDTPRKRGLKHGLFFFLLTFLVVPLITILTIWANAKPFLVVISAILFSVGGLLRMAYAMLFESNGAPGALPDGASGFVSAPRKTEISSGHITQTDGGYLPPQPANWRDTNELEPASVVDPTTKLLVKDR